MEPSTASSLEPYDTLALDPAFCTQLAAVDEALSHKALIDRVRFIDRDMVMQLFYVRSRIVADPSLPKKLRIAALTQLLATVEGLPDFILNTPEPEYSSHVRQSSRPRMQLGLMA